MKTLAFLFSIAFVVAAGSLGITEAQTKTKLLLVVNAENKLAKLDKGSVKNIYLGQQQFWGNDVRIKAYNRAHGGPIGKQFFRDVLGMTPSRYRHHWQKQQLAGQGVEPEVVGTAANLVAKIAATPGAVGYILESENAAVDARIKLIPID